MEEKELYFAPMEGITGGEFRRVHFRYFGGVDRYYMPFVSPTRDHVFTPRELRNIAPENNKGIPVVPQLLTKEPEDFLWAARSLMDMGYTEVNLNVGCPSGTVVAKGKGAGLLSDPKKLDRFLEEIFSAGLDLDISVKTRLGMRDPEEFGPLLEILGKYPIPLLILHPRVREDYYRRPIRMEAFEAAARSYRGSLCYNGGLVDVTGLEAFTKNHPNVDKIMVGQGFLADPALGRKYKGGPAAARAELEGFHGELYATYLRNFGSSRNAAFHMKELWGYLSRLFEGGDKLFKQLRKAQDAAAYENAVRRIFAELPLRDGPDWT